jgi:hypothetical protein
MYGEKMIKRDRFNLEAFTNCNVQDFVNALSGKRIRQVKRFRFATRGEVFYSSANILKVAEIAEAMPGTIFWIPTRAWRNPVRRAEIMTHLFPLPNVRVMASIDPSNSPAEISVLKTENWSTIFFGDNAQLEDRLMCPKTWHHIKGCCAKCECGCFSTKRVDVHLKEH